MAEIDSAPSSNRDLFAFPSVTVLEGEEGEGVCFIYLRERIRESLVPYLSYVCNWCEQAETEQKIVMDFNPLEVD